jgi:hypothetical protein
MKLDISLNSDIVLFGSAGGINPVADRQLGLPKIRSDYTRAISFNTWRGNKMAAGDEVTAGV